MLAVLYVPSGIAARHVEVALAATARIVEHAQDDIRIPITCECEWDGHITAQFASATHIIGVPAVSGRLCHGHDGRAVALR